MTTKELSEFFGKTKQTILNYAKKNNIEIMHGKEKIWIKEEVELIAKSIYKTMPIAIKESIDYTFSTVKIYNSKQSENLTGNLTEKDIEMISIIVSKTVSETVKALDSRMSNIENKYEERKSLLPAPKLSDRDNLRQIINSYSNINRSNRSYMKNKKGDMVLI